MAPGRYLEPTETKLVVEDVIEAYEIALFHIGVMNEHQENVYPAEIECTDEDMDLILTMSDGTKFKVVIEKI